MKRHYWYYRFLADVDWLNDFVDDIEDAFKVLLNSITSNAGVVTGMSVTERGLGQNFSVDVSSGWAYDAFGQYVFNNATVNVPFQDDAEGNPIECTGGGNERIVSIYAYYFVEDSDNVVDGNGDSVPTIGTEKVEYKLYQGTIAAANTATPAANPNDGGVLLAHITIATGDTTVSNSDIDTTVKDLFLIGVTADQAEIVDEGGYYDGNDVEEVLQEVGATLEQINGNLPPIGTILPFYDFDGALEIDTQYYRYCDGFVADIAGIGVQNLPDLSNRYLVGFGTEGGQDIDVAAWATAAVGNASHQVNLQHLHTVNSHTHDLGNHTHTGGSHTHGPGNLRFWFGSSTNGGLVQLFTEGGGGIFIGYNSDGTAGGSEEFAGCNWGTANLYTSPTNPLGSTASGGNVSTGSPSTNNSGGSSPDTNNQLSSAQSIQPRSIRVRFIMRVA